MVIADDAATLAALTAQGYEPATVKKSRRGDELLVRFFIQDPDDDKIEMLERHDRYQ